MAALLAQVSIAGWSVVHIALAVVVVAAIVALVTIALRQFGVSPPSWAVQAFWVVVVCFVICAAIILVARMAGAL